MPSFDIKDYMLLTLGIIILGLLWSLNNVQNELEDMTDARDKAKLEVGVGLANNVALRSAINAQNKRIRALRVVHANNLLELDKWKSKKPIIKYKTIYETVYKDRNITKEMSCEDIKKLSTSLDGFDLNGL